MKNSYKLYTGIFTIIIILLIVTILVMFFRRSFTIINIQPFENIWNNIKSDKLYSLIERTKNCFQELNIDFIPMYGSLLGIIRHNSIIPWDDDYDTCIHKKYFDTILENEKLFDKNDLKVIIKQPVLFENKFLKIFDKNEKLISERDWAWPFIDVFGYTIKNENLFLENNEIKNSKYVFSTNDFFPLQKSYFMLDNYKIEIKLPRNSEKILNNLYGNNWKEMCYSSGYNHQLEKHFTKVYKRKCNEIMKIE